LDRRLGGPQSRFGRCGEDKNIAPAGIRTPAVQPAARRYSECTPDLVTDIAGRRRNPQGKRRCGRSVNTWKNGLTDRMQRRNPKDEERFDRELWRKKIMSLGSEKLCTHRKIPLYIEYLTRSTNYEVSHYVNFAFLSLLLPC
jgi:hypothetical protein